MKGTHARLLRQCSRLLVLIVLAASKSSWSQVRAPIVPAVDVSVPSPPTPVRIAGKQHLGYEVHLTNLRPSDVTLTRFEVLDGTRGGRLATFGGRQLLQRIGRLAGDAARDSTVIAPGRRVVVFLWLTLDESTRTPSSLRHRIELDVTRASQQMHIVVEAGTTAVRETTPVTLSPPLRGGPWVALYDPLMPGGHRTSIYAVDGQARIPARFAIDWVRLGLDATHARADESLAANWYGYGADVLAVADGTAVTVADDMSEGASITDASRTPMPLESASGNFICLDVGNGRYAFYEHLAHGSIRVKQGERIKAGQVIARLGNSGSSSTGPHLHFHIADSSRDLSGEGLPYTFMRFEQIGAFETIDAVSTNQHWKAVPGLSGSRRDELPAANAVILFPPQD